MMTQKSKSVTEEAPTDASRSSDIVYPSAIPFVLVHLACFGAIWTGVTAQAVAIGVGLYWLRIFSIGAGYHRYFSHRSYETSRVFQFILAALSQSTAQKSVLWWAANHRDHHLHSDTELDVHSPRHFGFIYSHLGWIFARRQNETNLTRVADLTGYPELMWLHRYELAPPIVLGFGCFLAAGWPGLIVGFFWSTVAVYHATFCINSLAHIIGRRRYITGDDSRNNWLLAIFTMGEGWHNNHHAFQSSARQGFHWWEYDPTFYLLKLLERLGLVWNLKRPTAEVVQNKHRLGARIIGRAALQVANSFNAERIAQAAATVLGKSGLSELHLRLRQVQPMTAIAVLGELNLPHIPSKSEIVGRARSLLSNSPSLEEIATRAHELLLEAIGARLATLAAQSDYAG
jgi:stearoyl-CoA desaturase (Delta-9 desaturase)